MKHKLLLVDDEPANLRALERLFRDDHSVTTATSGLEAIALLQKHDFAVILSDQRMPGMTGIEFLMKAAELRPQTVRMILTGYTDAATLVEAINSGVVYKYVTKPWVNEDLKFTISRALEHFEANRAQHLAARENLRLAARSKAAVDAFVALATSLLDLRSPGRSAHASRVGLYAQALGSQLELEAEEIERLVLAARLHEMLEIFLPPETGAALRRREPWRANKTEREAAEAMLKVFGPSESALAEAAEAVASVYERFDGQGGPQRLSGQQIPLHARIIAVADLYDEFLHSSEFGEPGDELLAQTRIRGEAGKSLDPEIAALTACLAWVDSMIRTDVTTQELAGMLT
ncbi:MAG: response regulator [Pyrinomonadaceae bacterium]